MDQKKIGEFIASLRKEKNMTQLELAEKLNVTDRAVSNWENGRRMPDISLFKPLCEVLNISVNELIMGEKISNDNVISTSDETIIKTLNKNIKSKNIIKVLCILLVLTIVIMSIIPTNIYKNNYSKIDIYSLILDAAVPDYGFKLEKKFQYELKKEGTNISYNSLKHDVYYYGLDDASICDVNENCTSIEQAIKHKQTSIEEIKKYLESQLALGNNLSYRLYDGGTTIYQNDRYQVIFCNTTNGNKDVYIGLSEMMDNLNGAYCGKDEYETKNFIRTYHIIEVKEDSNNDELFIVTLKGNNEKQAVVKINKSNKIIVGNDYEFSFYTDISFEDTIENIFKYSTIMEINETDKIGSEQINEKIYINDDLDNYGELNEVEHVSMVIEEGTLTKTSAEIVITDLSGKNHIYGSWFKLEKYENNKWVDVKETGENYGFDSMAYGVDKENKLRMGCNWKHMYGELESGKYRIIKEVYNKYISVEFIIK